LSIPQRDSDPCPGGIGRQVRQADEPGFAEDDHSLDDVFQLANISRPVVFPQVNARLRGDFDRSVVLPIGPVEEKIDEQGDVRSAGAQRGKMNGDHLKPVKQVLPKRPPFYFFFQVLVEDKSGFLFHEFSASLSPSRMVLSLADHEATAVPVAAQ
jgi:hypothetical protein